MNEFVTITATQDGETIGRRTWHADDIFHALEQIQIADLLVGYGGDEILVAVGEADLV